MITNISISHQERMLRHLEGQVRVIRPRPEEFADFIRAAIEQFAFSHTLPVCGVGLKDVRVDEGGNVRARISDGSSLVIEITHMVPRDYFAAEHRE